MQDQDQPVYILKLNKGSTNMYSFDSQSKKRLQENSEPQVTHMLCKRVKLEQEEGEAANYEDNEPMECLVAELPDVCTAEELVGVGEEVVLEHAEEEIVPEVGISEGQLDLDDDDILVQHMDIREPLSKLRSLLEQRLNTSLAEYGFWLQDAQTLESHKNLVDQCVQGEGLVQINVQIKIDGDIRKINIVDVLKPAEDVELGDEIPEEDEEEEEQQQQKPQNVIRWVVDSNYKREQEKLKIPTEKDIQMKWKKLRDKCWEDINKLLKLRSSNGAEEGAALNNCGTRCCPLLEKAKWIYVNTPKFLLNHFTPQETVAILQSDVVDPASVDPDEDISDEMSTCPVSTSPSPSTLSTTTLDSRSNNRKTLLKRQSLNDIEKKRSDIEEIKVLAENRHTPNKVSGFFDSLLPHIGKLSDEKNMLLMMDIQHLVYKHVYGRNSLLSQSDANLVSNMGVHNQYSTASYDQASGDNFIYPNTSCNCGESQMTQCLDDRNSTD